MNDSKAEEATKEEAPVLSREQKFETLARRIAQAKPGELPALADTAREMYATLRGSRASARAKVDPDTVIGNRVLLAVFNANAAEGEPAACYVIVPVKDVLDVERYAQSCGLGVFRLVPSLTTNDIARATEFVAAYTAHDDQAPEAPTEG